MKKFYLLTKTLLAAAMLCVGTNAWGDEYSNTTNHTWLFSQFYDDATVATITTTSDTKGLVYEFDGLYLCVGDGSADRTRTLTAKAVSMPNATAPSVSEVTPFAKGSYVGLTFNAASRAFANNTADATSNYNLASMRFGSAGKLYALVLPKATGNSVKISTYNSAEGHKTMEDQATVTRTEESGTNWLLISCDVTSGRYFIGSQDNSWTLFAVKFVPTTDKADRKTATVNMSNGYATFSSCTNFAVPTGYHAYKAKVSGENAVLTEISNIPANTGVILMGETTASLELKSATSADADVSNNDLVANIGGYALPASNGSYYNYTLAYDEGPVFMHSSGEGTLAAGKAFLRTTVNVTGGSGSARSIKLVFGSDVITGISQKEAVNDKKENDGIYYNLSGQRVINPTKGLYIVNGKKVFIN